MNLKTKLNKHERFNISIGCAIAAYLAFIFWTALDKPLAMWTSLIAFILFMAGAMGAWKCDCQKCCTDDL